MIDELDLGERWFVSQDQATEILKKTISVESAPRHRIRITSVRPDLEEAQEIADTVARVYVERRAREEKERAISARAALEAEIAEQERTVEEARWALVRSILTWDSSRKRLELQQDYQSARSMLQTMEITVGTRVVALGNVSYPGRVLGRITPPKKRSHTLKALLLGASIGGMGGSLLAAFLRPQAPSAERDECPW